MESNRIQFARSNCPQKKILSIERNDRKLHTPTTIWYKNTPLRYEDRDVATNTVATAGILIQPVTQSIQSVKRLFVVFFETQKSTKSAGTEEIIPVQQRVNHSQITYC